MMGAGLRSGSQLRTRRLDGSDVDPMSNVANVSDAMLVLAVAFLLALIAYWNVALPGAERIERDASRVDGAIPISGEQHDGAGYERAGTVYRDAVTGELYMVEDGAESAGAGADAGSGADADADAESAGASSAD